MKKNLQTFLIVLAVLSIVGIGVTYIGGQFGWFTTIQQSQVGTPLGDNTATTSITTSAAATAVTAYDTLGGSSRGASFTIQTLQAGVNGGSLNTFTSGTTTLDQFSEVVFLAANTSYHTALFKDTVGNVKVYTKEIPMVKNATSVTIAVYNTAKGAMTNGGGATNQTVTTGSAPTMELDITGTDSASTQDMVCIVEGSDTSTINKLVLSGFGATFKGQTKPSSYTLAGTGSGIWVYEIPAVNDASLRVGSIYAESKSGQDMTGDYFKFTCYTKEYFTDANKDAGSNVYAKKVAEPNVYYGIEDSAGTRKSIASYTFTGYFD